MKDCRDVEPLKAPYVDGDAGPADRAAVDTHVARCGRCREEVAVEQTARDVLAARRDELRATMAPAALKARCAAHAAGRRRAPAVAAVPRRVPLYQRWVPMSLAATLLFALAGVFGLGLTDKSQALAFQMTLDHFGCSRSARHSEAGAHAAGAQWAQRFGWETRVAPSTQEPPLRLKALRRCFVLDGRVAHAIYDWDGQPLSVYVLPGEQLRAAADVHRFGHEAVMWSRNGRTYVVLTRAPRRPEFDRVVAHVKATVY
jgi:anti-sigma factor RsiW